MTVTINWSFLGSIFAALAGVAGTVITPVYGASLGSSVSAVLQALSGLLIAIPTYHVSSVAATTAKAKALAKYTPPPHLPGNALEVA